VANASSDRDRIIKELVGLWAVLKHVSRLVEDERGQTSGAKTSSRFPALNDVLLRCADEMKSLRAAFDGETGPNEAASAGNAESLEMERMEAATDINRASNETKIQAVLESNMESIQAALRGDIKGFLAMLEKYLGRKGVMRAFWPLKEADLNKTVDSIRKHQDMLMDAIGVDQTYVPFAVRDLILIVFHRRLTLEIDTGVRALDEKTDRVIQLVDEVKLRLDSATLETHGLLKSQGAETKEAIEGAERLREVIQDALTEQRAKMNRSMEQAELRTLHVVIVSICGALILTASLCRKTSSGSLCMAEGS
jgi:hypothetical protein